MLDTSLKILTSSREIPGHFRRILNAYRKILCRSREVLDSSREILRGCRKLLSYCLEAFYGFNADHTHFRLQKFRTGQGERERGGVGGGIILLSRSVICRFNQRSAMNIQNPSANPYGWKKSFLWMALAVACFHAAYTSIKFPALGLFIFGYTYFLVRLTDQPTVKRAFYFGLAVGFLCAAPQTGFFWGIFKQAAIILWLVFAFWIGLFTAIVCGCIRHWEKVKAIWLIPIVWTGLEYFRSELYYLKFSWLNIGYALPPSFQISGMYGIGFLIFGILAACSFQKFKMFLTFLIGAILLMILNPALKYAMRETSLSVVGIQMEFPTESIVPKALDKALHKNPDSQMFVLSEYTLNGSVPDSLKKWCQEHSRFLIIGGKDFVTNDVYYNTAFVVGTNGERKYKLNARVIDLLGF